MNRKQLTLILALVVVLGGLGLWLRQRNVASFRSSEGRMGQKVLGDFDVNAVTQVTIKNGTNTLDLIQKDAGWTVSQRGGYPANFSEVSDFLRKLWELKVVQSQAIGPSQLARLELKTPGTGATNETGTLVELKDKTGKTIRAVVLGKKHLRQSGGPTPLGGDEGWPDGRYVMVEGKPNVVSLVSEPFSSAEPKPDQWLNKDFFKVEHVKSVEVTYPVTSNSWKIYRDTENGDLKLADAKPDEKLDTAKVSGIPNALAFPSFNDVVVDPKPDQTGLDSSTVVKLETFDHFTYTVKIGKKSGDEAYYLSFAVSADLPKERTPAKDEKPADKEKLDKAFKDANDKLLDKLKAEEALSKWVYLVPKWTLDTLLKDRHSLFAEPPKPAGATNAVPAAVSSTTPINPLEPAESTTNEPAKP